MMDLQVKGPKVIEGKQSKCDIELLNKALQHDVFKLELNLSCWVHDRVVWNQKFQWVWSFCWNQTSAPRVRKRKGSFGCTHVVAFSQS